MQHHERRRVQRVHPLKPLPGRIGTQKVFVVDVSLHGMRLAHQYDLGNPGDACHVVFDWDGQHLSMTCRLTRTDVQRAATGSSRALMHSGAMISEISREARATLRTLIEDHVLRALDEQRANARGIPAVAAQSFQTGHGEQFIRHELHAGHWRAVPTVETRQPANGFTISAAQTPIEVQMLRDAYASGDAAARAMIRSMSELSISKTEGIPTRRYMP
jgi:hypothetical protein